MLQTQHHEQAVIELQLDRPPVNALNPELVARLREAMVEAIDDGAQALVLSGQPGLFSAGLDVPHLLGLDRGGMREFWQEFFALLEQAARSPVPVAAALTGHSPAGGTVIALFADYRVQAEGDFRLGLNEVQVGLIVPPIIHQALVRLIGPYPAERHLVAGEMIPASDAHALGLVDELAAPEQTVARAVGWCQELLALPRHSMLGTRQLCRAPLGALFDSREALDVDGFVDAWFADQTQVTLRQLVERLQQKK
ncbi:MAG: enoyl-CoA hydratase/isomerase family protein [Pseudomonadota bacterium]|nr:MAG: enoyl-CoA hydratase/isomerase family protein [Pseudomonadota bacterium]